MPSLSSKNTDDRTRKFPGIEITGITVMKSQKRYFISDLICQYLASHGTRQIEVTARDIVDFYRLPSVYRYSIAALLKRVFDNGIRDPRYGFYVVKVKDIKKNKKPRAYTIKLIQTK